MSKPDTGHPFFSIIERNRTQLTRRRFLGATGLGILSASGLLAACGGDDDEGTAAGPTTSGAATEEQEPISGQTIRFVNYTDWIGEGEYDDFKELTGVTVTEIAVNSERVSRITADPSSADLVLLDLHQAGQLDAAGLLGQFNLDRIPNYAGVDPAFKDGLAADSVGKVLATDYGRTGIVYRTDMVSEEITSWNDVWELAPKYSGKISFLDNEVGVIPITLITLGYPGNSEDEGQCNEAADKLIEIKPHLQALVTGDHMKALLDGTAAIGMVEDWAGSAGVTGNPDVPLKWVDPEKTTGYLDCWGAVEGTDVMAAIEAFADYHFTPEVYANYCNTLSIASIVPEADPLINEEITSNPITYPPPEVYETVEFQDYLGEGQRYHDEAWAKFKSA
ncbi:MAG TPA: extracellular solute-binding protein [Gaiellaceae bacterium]|nr:extracellular solute-binding protein [Gaiellaceae bacterium]